MTDPSAGGILIEPSARCRVSNQLSSVEQIAYKENAEAVLRGLPSVIGAFVQPDAFGRPREIHLLIEAGPRPRDFAEQVKDVLESKLRIPIDQRIVSIAQVARPRTPVLVEPSTEPRAPLQDRVRLTRVNSGISAGRAHVSVQLARGDDVFHGEAVEFAADDGNARAAARATIEAVNAMTGNAGRFSLDYATSVAAFGRRYILVSATVTSPRLGRRSVPVAGAQVIEDEEQAAAALAALKAVNRLVQFALIPMDRSARSGREAR
ncbi:MAG: hypothetical protein ACREL7_02780 [Longimicrobiales bacterium]